MKRAIFLTLFFTGLNVGLNPSVALATEQGHGQNWTQCGEFKEADDTLNSTYQRILEQYAGKTNFLKKLKEAQRIWIQFRDAQLNAIFPESDKENQYGHDFQMCDCTYRAALTKERTAHLKLWLTGVEEGEVCAGTYKVAPSTKH